LAKLIKLLARLTLIAIVFLIVLLLLLLHFVDLGVRSNVWLGINVAKVCYSAESAMLYTRGLKLLHPRSVLLFACGIEMVF
jgi:hypothetical protein